MKWLIPIVVALAAVSAPAWDVEPWVEPDTVGLAVSFPLGKEPVRQYAQAAIDPEGGWRVEGGEYIPPGGQRRSSVRKAEPRRLAWHQRAGAWVYQHRWKIGTGMALVGAVKVWEHNDWWPFDGGSSGGNTTTSSSSQTTEDNSARTFVNGPQQHVNLEVSGNNNQVNVTVNNTPPAEPAP